MIKTVIVRGVEIGAGIPKICVPIVGTTMEEIRTQAAAVAQSPADVVEWRIDWFDEVFNTEALCAAAAELRALLGEKPILATFRTSAEGGEKSVEPAVYKSLLAALAESGSIDLVDVELMIGDGTFASVLENAHQNGVYVIASNHDFHATPAKEEILRRLNRMQELGADIAKIAVMPGSSADVLTLLSATTEMRDCCAKVPLITMSMSGTGVISRLCGEEFGSALTFGAVGKASAPGQIGAEELAQVLALLHRSR